VAEHLAQLVHLVVAAEHRRDFVLPGELIQVRGEMLEKRRQLEALLQPFFVELVIAHPRGEPRDERLGLDTVPPDDRDGNSLSLFKDCREQIGRLDRVPSGPGGMQQRQLEQQLGRRSYAEIPSGHARQEAEMLFERLQNFVGVELQVPDNLTEHVPLDLGEREADVLICQQRVFAAARLVESAIDDALGRLSHFVLRDIEILHGRLHRDSAPGLSPDGHRCRSGTAKDRPAVNNASSGT
jgi:hypothetical protein